MDRIFNLKPRNQEAFEALGASFAEAASASFTELFSQEPNNPLEPTPVPNARSVGFGSGAALSLGVMSMLRINTSAAITVRKSGAPIGTTLEFKRAGSRIVESISG